jgi:hypothetical protein
MAKKKKGKEKLKWIGKQSEIFEGIREVLDSNKFTEIEKNLLTRCRNNSEKKENPINLTMREHSWMYLN